MTEQQTQSGEMWATVELMGHAETAGRISRPADWGGLLRVDVPTDNEGGYRTEYFGMSAIYSIKVVSEEIARAYARPSRSVVAYDTPIVTREQHESAMRQAQRENQRLENEVSQLRQRLTQVNALPAPADDDRKELDEDEDHGL